MNVREELPSDFVAELDELARSYLEEDDPIRASGFGGGPQRWRAEREPVLDAVERSGSFLDVGCANGYLLSCLVRWGVERGLKIEPHGLDRSPELVERARVMLPHFAGNMHVGDAWSWLPPTRYDYVYSLYDCVPRDYLPEYVDRVMARAVAAGGRLIVGSYGSLTNGVPPYDVVGLLESRGYVVVGSSAGGTGPVSLFAWTDRPESVGV